MAVSISAPCSTKRSTSSLSPAAHAARNTHPEENFTFCGRCRGAADARFVSESSQRFNCSARLNSAELDRVSIDILNCTNTIRTPFYTQLRTALLIVGYDRLAQECQGHLIEGAVLTCLLAPSTFTNWKNNDVNKSVPLKRRNPYALSGIGPRRWACFATESACSTTSNI